MKFGKRTCGEGRRLRPMDISNTGFRRHTDSAGSEMLSIAGTTAMTCDNEGTTVAGDLADDFDDFCFGGADDAELAKDRCHNGECPECGIQCFEINQATGEHIPLNVPGSIENGVCLMCLIGDPTNVTDVNGSNAQPSRNADGEIIVTEAEYCVQFRDVTATMANVRRSKSVPAPSTKRPSFTLFCSNHRPSVSFNRNINGLSSKSKQSRYLEERITIAENSLRPLESEEDVVSALREIICLLQKNPSLAKVSSLYDLIPLLLAAMIKFKTHSKIQQKATILLSLIVQEGGELTLGIVAHNQGVSTLLQSAQSHLENPHVLRDVCYALYRISASPRNAAEIIADETTGGVGFLLSVMRKYSLDEHIVMYIVGTLYQISKIQVNSLIRENKLMESVLEAMKKHKKSKDMQQIGCKLLHLLASEGTIETRDRLVDLKVVSQMLSSMKTCMSSALVARQGMLTLTALVVSNISARSEIVREEDKGLAIIFECMRKHEKDVHVQIEGCRLIKALSNGATSDTIMASLHKASNRKIVERANEKITHEMGSLASKLILRTTP